MWNVADFMGLEKTNFVVRSKLAICCVFTDFDLPELTLLVVMDNGVVKS